MPREGYHKDSQRPVCKMTRSSKHRLLGMRITWIIRILKWKTKHVPHCVGYCGYSYRGKSEKASYNPGLLTSCHRSIQSSTKVKENVNQSCNSESFIRKRDLLLYTFFIFDNISSGEPANDIWSRGLISMKSLYL